MSCFPLGAIGAALVFGVLALTATGRDKDRDTLTYRVPSESMRPTLELGDVLQIDTAAYDRDRRPRIGDIVLFEPPTGAQTNRCGRRPKEGQACGRPTPKRSVGLHLIKRVTATPGMTVQVIEGRVILNGKRQREPFIRACADSYDPQCNYPTPLKVAKGHYFVLGDNRAGSDDSRNWGPVPRGWIVGRAPVKSP